MHGTDLDHSPTHSPAVSPTPKEAREAWADGTPENVEEMHFGSPDTSLTEVCVVIIGLWMSLWLVTFNDLLLEKNLKLLKQGKHIDTVAFDMQFSLD